MSADDPILLEQRQTPSTQPLTPRTAMPTPNGEHIDPHEIPLSPHAA